MATVQSFKFFSSVNTPTDNLIPVTTTPTVIGELNITDLRQGDLIWLNAVVGGVDNDSSTTFASVELKIFKGQLTFPGQEIYKAVQEVDREGNADIVNVPLSYVDVIGTGITSARYLLTVQLAQNVNSVFVDGPITFTATQIRPA
ncbi:hypothetical protein NNC19_07460 [Clostridium sp. SHJSY1]|uniref:hypothetical protein n=1 Tax=Clostridium sp. SHJSY1 TaxID=2942483 RepID=UPI002876E28F|nr:hypothetical protein [Clostridium sp. SHJSY1]MDS0525512.1 hypothetical protein [Clostridium sp. SHJSY1]